MDQLDELAVRLAAGGRPTPADARTLADTRDLIALGTLADEARRRRHGSRVTFVRVHEVPVSAALAGGSLEPPEGAGEIRLTGGLPPLEQALEAVRQAAQQARGIPVSGFSLGDLEAQAAASGRPLAGALASLRDAGLDLVADAPFDALAGPAAALAAAREAGLPIARLTLREPPAGLLRVLEEIAALGDAAGVALALAPLPATVPSDAPSTGYDDVRQVALARLLVDNIGSIQVDWSRHGAKLAQVALTFGADDLDHVPAVDARDLGPRRALLEEVRRNIRAASFAPAERNGRFQILTDAADPAGRR